MAHIAGTAKKALAFHRSGSIAALRGSSGTWSRMSVANKMTQRGRTKPAKSVSVHLTKRRMRGIKLRA